MTDFTYQPRLADARLAALMAEFPAILLNGPRAVGKTTTARQVVADVVRLDQPAQAAAFRADPDAALLTRREPLLLDEWQEVPAVLGAVRRAVDDDSRPGRFVLTGSVRAEMEHQAWAGTGRLVRLAMYGLTESEVRGLVAPERSGFLDRLERGDPGAFALPADRPRLPEYVELAVRSGFPEVALRPRSLSARATWLDSYLDQLLTRDVLAMDPRRNGHKMRAYFEALALSTGGLPTDRTLIDAAGINAKTASSYDRLFAELFVTDSIPAWGSNRLSRLVHTPKRYIVDSGLAAAAGGLTATSVFEDGDLLGRTLDTFVVSHLRVEAALLPSRRRLHHLRTKEGRHEVDVVVELGGGQVLGIEVKATASPSRDDARHLLWMRDTLGARFVAGAVVHCGPDVFALGDRLVAVPICALWGD